MLSVHGLLDGARERTGLDNFGDESFMEGLEKLVDALGREGGLSQSGEQIMGLRLGMLLANRLHIEQTYLSVPSIETQEVEGPIVILGLPRTGTTAVSQLVGCDPQVRSLRLWESSAPVPPPEASTQDLDPRIAETQRGLDAMYEAFPKMSSLYFQTATGATECQDLLGMEFRTAHFDGMARVPSYTSWVLGCDMAPAYSYHRRTLRLLQWHCPPRLWQLKTPVHMLSLDPLLAAYPHARFLWTHRDPAEVLGSVCSLVSFTRSWVSEPSDPKELGAEQLELWTEALGRAVEFRESVGEEGFGDVYFGELNVDPVRAIESAYSHLGLEMSGEAAEAMKRWALSNARGSHGEHEFSLEEFGLDPKKVRDRFASYMGHFDVFR
jgi:hypothetical protein